MQPIPAAPKPNLLRTRLTAIACILVGIASWWYNWHDVKTSGTFSYKLTLLGPLGLVAGVLFFFKPEWTGPLRRDSTREHKIALFAGIAFMLVLSAIDFYFLLNYHP
jgi:hypothetical protein